MKAVDYTEMENKERDNIIIKLSRGAKSSPTTEQTLSFQALQLLVFFHRRLFLEVQIQMDDC